MGPKELHVFDFDGTLYQSPAPPNEEEAGTWYFHAYSIGEPGVPGFDSRWNLPLILRARRSVEDPRAAVVLLTGRPDHKPMKDAIYRALAKIDVRWDGIILRPVFYPGSIPQFKAYCVQEWLKKMPSVEKVVFYDDSETNLGLVGQAVTAQGKHYVPVCTKP